MGIGIVEWVNEVHASMWAWHLAPIDQAYLIYDHLEGPAKDEVKYRPRHDHVHSPESVWMFTVLQKDLFSRKQRKGESFQE